MRFDRRVYETKEESVSATTFSSNDEGQELSSLS